jgi:excisionase family DNA binding protein
MSSTRNFVQELVHLRGRGPAAPRVHGSTAERDRRPGQRAARGEGIRGASPKARPSFKCTPSHAYRRKRPQTSAPLKVRSLLDETDNMPTPLSPAQPRHERQLVFTSSQAARYLGVSLATIRRWTDAGHVGCYRTPGGQRRFSREQLDEFVASMQRGRNAGTRSGEQRSADVA